MSRSAPLLRALALLALAEAALSISIPGLFGGGRASPKAPELRSNKMAPKLKLTYFNINGGRAQPIRLCLAMGGVEFEDIRITGADLPEAKKTAPMGSFPTLEVDGKMFCQSAAMLRYCGKLTGMIPTDDIAALHCDQMLGAYDDIAAKIGPSLYEKDQDKKMAMRKELAETTLPTLLQYVENILQGNGYKYSAGDELTIGDLVLYAAFIWLAGGILEGIPKDIAYKYTKLVAIARAVDEHPKVVEWNEKTGYKSVIPPP